MALTQQYFVAPPIDRNFLVLQVCVATVDTDGNMYDVREVEVQHFPNSATLEIDYQYANRVNVEQTYKNYVVSRAGRGVDRVTIRGTFGTLPNRVGLAQVTPFTQLVAFRERIYKAVVSQDVQTLSDLYQSDVQFNEGDVLFINYLDFYNKEFRIGEIRSFEVSESAEGKGQIPFFTLGFELLGPPVYPANDQTEHGWLKALFEADKQLNRIYRGLNEFTNNILSEEPFVTLGLVVDGVEALDTTIRAITRTIPSIADTYSGKALVNAGQEIPGIIGDAFGSSERAVSRIVSNLSF